MHSVCEIKKKTNGAQHTLESQHNMGVQTVYPNCWTNWLKGMLPRDGMHRLEIKGMHKYFRERECM